jgi:hypothetical protein
VPFWRVRYDVSLRGANSHCIDVIVTLDEVAPWRGTFVYGEPKRELWHIF